VPIYTPTTKTPDEFFAKPKPGNAEYDAELLNLFTLLLAQYASAGVRTRYLELLEIAYEELRVRCVKIVTAGAAAFRPVMRFPDRGMIMRADGRLDYKALVSPEMRARFLLNLLTQYEAFATKNTPDLVLIECVSSLVIGLKRLLDDPKSSPGGFHK